MEYVKVNNELYHHGILGQKWGVRNGPPYPLSSGAHSAREKKAGWTKSVSKSKETAKSTKASSGSEKKAGVAAEIGIGLAYVAALMATALASRGISELVYKHDINKHLKNADPDEFIKSTKKYTQDQDMKMVNPGYESGLPEYRMNCTMCSATYELRRRGYDVQANSTTMGRKVKDAKTWFNIDDSKIIENKAFDDFKSSLNREPDGARGSIFAGYGNFDSYHCMVWEKENGVVSIRDCQNGKLYKTIDASPINRHSRITYSYYRTDNAEINMSAIKDAVKNRGN